MWAGLGSKPLQLVATRDIGLFAARAFEKPKEYQGRAVSLAGDELSLEQGKGVFRKEMGFEMPETWGFVGSGIKMASREMGTMFDWFGEEGYGADIKKLREEEPKVMDFATWLREESGFKKQ